MSTAAGPHPGWVDPELGAEFPELRLLALELAARPGRTSPGARERLGVLSDAFRGAEAMMLRRRPVPSAYRIFFRHIGLDPDTARTPVEAAALERLLAGGFRPTNGVDDALTIAVVETGVPVWALDAGGVRGALGIRPARDGERLGEGAAATPLPPGRLVVADERGPAAVLFDDPAPGRGVTRATTGMMLFTVGVAGVPDIHLEEALWLCQELLLEDA